MSALAVGAVVTHAANPTRRMTVVAFLPRFMVECHWFEDTELMKEEYTRASLTVEQPTAQERASALGLEYQPAQGAGTKLTCFKLAAHPVNVGAPAPV